MANMAAAPDGSEVARLIRVLGTLQPFSYAKVKSPPEAWLARWFTRLLVIGVVVLALVAVMALVHQYRKLPPAAIQVALVAVAVSQIAAILALFAQTGSGACSLLHPHRRRSELLEQAYQHDHQNALSLQQFSAAALDEADPWLEKTMKRLERRPVRFFGSSDQLAYQRDVLAAARALKRASAPLAPVGIRGGIARTLPAAALHCPHWNAAA
ncbi:hypothetical protein [Caldimonas brevitalea]|uniref:Uncharacterized protein n=1 Tax=Caldimonas brevitalea TaxID=413882 RepID=A0A0G3BRE0_9BURK|nr:hypothetical protein [Caldimonas brevitalea]AKJ31987.1 hypothetical protein AAW51_5296 [Caldimonas brevitalea]